MKWIISPILILCTVVSFSQEGINVFYTDSLDLIPRDDAIAFSTDFGVFLGTGNHGGFAESNRFYRYDESEDKVIEVTTFPGPSRQYALASNHNEYGILIGGISGSGIPLNDVWVYNSELNSWEERDNTPFEARWAACTFKIHETIYVGLGRDTSTAFSDFWKYDVENDTWEEVASLPFIPRFETVAFSLYQKGYVGLGKEYDGELQSNFYAYNPDLNSWLEVASFPAGPRYYANAEKMQGFGYVIGGQDTAGVIQNDVWRYEPISNTWEELVLDYIPARRGLATCVLRDRKIIAFCGLNDNFSRKSSVITLDSNGFSPAQGSLRNCAGFYDASNQSLYFSEVHINDFVRIYDMAGKLIFAYKITDESLGIDCSEMVSGVYIAAHGSCRIKFVVAE